jgi:hypothetical protein
LSSSSVGMLWTPKRAGPDSRLGEFATRDAISRLVPRSPAPTSPGPHQGAHMSATPAAASARPGRKQASVTVTGLFSKERAVLHRRIRVEALYRSFNGTIGRAAGHRTNCGSDIFATLHIQRTSKRA